MYSSSAQKTYIKLYESALEKLAVHYKKENQGNEQTSKRK